MKELFIVDHFLYFLALTVSVFFSTLRLDCPSSFFPSNFLPADHLNLNHQRR